MFVDLSAYEDIERVIREGQFHGVTHCESHVSIAVVFGGKDDSSFIDTYADDKAKNVEQDSYR